MGLDHLGLLLWHSSLIHHPAVAFESEDEVQELTTPSYVALVAVRDEEKYISRSLRSIVNQTIKPQNILLVDDGSIDKTIPIAMKEGIEILSYKQNRYKVKGINQAKALIAGVSELTISNPDWKYLLKFDGDTVIPPDYVEHLLNIMIMDSRLGICAGKPIKEKIRLSRASDAARIYKRECWDDIKGIDPLMAFDSHALLKARQAGWKVATIPTITFKELRPSGKYKLERWILTGFERASFGFPLYHTVLAAAKNITRGRPLILNFFATVLAHILNPYYHAPNLDRSWIRRFAIYEVTDFAKELWRTLLGGR